MRQMKRGGTCALHPPCGKDREDRSTRDHAKNIITVFSPQPPEPPNSIEHNFTVLSIRERRRHERQHTRERGRSGAPYNRENKTRKRRRKQKKIFRIRRRNNTTFGIYTTAAGRPARHGTVLHVTARPSHGQGTTTKKSVCINTHEKQ